MKETCLAWEFRDVMRFWFAPVTRLVNFKLQMYGQFQGFPAVIVHVLGLVIEWRLEKWMTEIVFFFLLGLFSGFSYYFMYSVLSVVLEINMQFQCQCLSLDMSLSLISASTLGARR